MSRKLGYKAAPTNKNVGNKTHGSFKNDGQKSGKHGAIASKPAKEDLKNTDSLTYMKKTIAEMRKNGKRRIQMMPDSGAYHQKQFMGLKSNVCALGVILASSLTLSSVYAADSRIKTLGGQVLLDGRVETTQSHQFDNRLEPVGISTPTATPKTNHAYLWLNNTAKQLCTKYDDGSSGCLSAGGAAGTITGVTAGLGLSGGGTSGTVTINLSTPITNSYIDGSSVTKQGNSFNSGSQLLQLSGGLVPNSNIDSSSITKQSNSFNGASQLVQLNSSTQLPAVSGVNLTNLNASNLASGTVGDARLSSNVQLLASTQTRTAGITNQSSSTFNGTVAISSGFLASGSAGTSGQVLTSGGANSIPTWTTVTSGSGSGTVSTGTAGQFAYYPNSTNLVQALSGLTTTQAVYMLNLFSYRRPTLIWESTWTVRIETGTLQSATTAVSILFPDGQLRTTTISTYTVLDLSRVASLSGTKQSGLTNGTAATNTWYGVYACKATDTNDVVVIATPTLNVSASSVTLNNYCGTNGWVYLGTVPYGDGFNVNKGVGQFVQTGNEFMMYNTNVGYLATQSGLSYAENSGGTDQVGWVYSTGSTVGTNVPPYFKMLLWHVAMGDNFGGGSTPSIFDVNGTRYYSRFTNAAGTILVTSLWMPAVEGILIKDGAGLHESQDGLVGGWIDTALGVGSNPLFQEKLLNEKIVICFISVDWS